MIKLIFARQHTRPSRTVLQPEGTTVKTKIWGRLCAYIFLVAGHRCKITWTHWYRYIVGGSSVSRSSYLGFDFPWSAPLFGNGLHLTCFSLATIVPTIITSPIYRTRSYIRTLQPSIVTLKTAAIAEYLNISWSRGIFYINTYVSSFFLNTYRLKYMWSEKSNSSHIIFWNYHNVFKFKRKVKKDSYMPLDGLQNKFTIYTK